MFKERIVTTVSYSLYDDAISVQKVDDMWFIDGDFEKEVKSAKQAAKELRKLSDALTAVASKLEGIK